MGNGVDRPDKQQFSLPEPSWWEGVRLDVGAGVSVRRPSEDGGRERGHAVGTRFDISPSYRILDTGRVRVNGVADLFVERGSDVSRGGGGVGAEVNLFPFSSDAFGLVAGVTGGPMGDSETGLGGQLHAFGGFRLFDTVTVQGGYRVQAGRDPTTVTANVDVLSWFRKGKVEERETRERELLARYDTYFDPVRQVRSGENFGRHNRDFHSQVQAQRSRFLTTVRFLRERGAKLKFDGNVNFVFRGKLDAEYGTLAALDRAFARTPLKLRHPRQFSSDLRSLEDLSPHLLIENRGREVLEIDREIWSDSIKEGVSFTPYALYHDYQDGYFRIVVWNLFEDKPLFDKVYPKGVRDDFFWQALAYEVGEAIRANSQAFDLDDAIAALPPLTGDQIRELGERRVFRLEQPRIWSREETLAARSSWERFGDRFSVTFHARPASTEVDREQKQEVFSDPMIFVLDTKTLRNRPDNSATNYGLLDYVHLAVKTEEATLSLGKDPKFKGPFEGFIRDKYGNIIFPIIDRHAKTGEPLFLGFDIVPPFSLADGTPQGEVANVGVDLSRFGFGDHPHLLTAKVIQPARRPYKACPYYLYDTLPPGDKAKAAGVFEKACEQARWTEEYFGFNAGERVKGTFFIPSYNENASVRVANPEVFFLWDEVFERLTNGSKDHI